MYIETVAESKSIVTLYVDDFVIVLNDNELESLRMF